MIERLALAHVGACRLNLDGTFRIFPQLRDSLNYVALAVARKPCAMVHRRKAYTPAKPTPPGLVRFFFPVVITGFQHLFYHGRYRDREMIPPACRGEVPHLRYMPQLIINRIDAQVICDMRHHHLDRKECLRAAETPKRAARDVVCLSRLPAHLQVRDVIHSASANYTPLQDNRRHRCVSSGVVKNFDYHSGDYPVFYRCLVCAERRVPLAG
jgi:hypothetical protein